MKTWFCGSENSRLCTSSSNRSAALCWRSAATFACSSERWARPAITAPQPSPATATMAATTEATASRPRRAG